MAEDGIRLGEKKRQGIVLFEPGGPGSSRVRLRTLVTIRWIAVAGQAVALAAAHWGLGLPLPLVPSLLVVAVSVALNLLILEYRPRGLWLGDREAAVYLGYDLLQLAVLLALTGGLTNPFSILIMAPITVSASLLSRVSTLALAGLGLVCVTLLAVYYIPLSWDRLGLTFGPLYLWGLWASLVITILFIAAYVYSMASEASRMSAALRASDLALAREQQLSAVGALAAAAAHELGTPLGTIAVVAKELQNEVGKDSAWADDLRLLKEESDRCRDILAQLVARPDSDGGSPFHRLPLEGLIEAAATPYRLEGKKLLVTCNPPTGQTDLDQPEVPRTAVLLQGLGLLLQNGLQFAESLVEVEISWDSETVVLIIHDDGPGFNPAVLERLGQPYVGEGRKRRNTASQPMGLGIFITHALLARTGARLLFGNHPEGGGIVEIRWDRATLEESDQMATGNHD
ncbi:ActS/PrrB/RegB family redox-sensitive histidine kinase [Limibacillus sp. MBR-115]|jgi:two-component system sensor histidine kinase RegB|uniref:ActS/PrrB/RegB family redox-sensitive histidine kinase n=1 Tax=Limibacillus sp. MBR-115 TaxID=3156465 RepID=UPI0033928562